MGFPSATHCREMHSLSIRSLMCHSQVGGLPRGPKPYLWARPRLRNIRTKSCAHMAAIGATGGEEAAVCSQHMQQWLCSTRCRCCATFVPPAQHLAGKLGAFPVQTHVLVLDRGWGWLQSQPSREGSPSSTVCSPCSSQRRML